MILFCFPGIVPTVCSAEVTQNEPSLLCTHAHCPGMLVKSLSVWSQAALCETPVWPLNKTWGLSCFTCEVGALIVCASSGVSTTALLPAGLDLGVQG